MGDVPICEICGGLGWSHSADCKDIQHEAELDRLRAEVELWRGRCESAVEQRDWLHSENEQLRESLRTAGEKWADSVRDGLDLRAENERLREEMKRTIGAGSTDTICRLVKERDELRQKYENEKDLVRKSFGEICHLSDLSGDLRARLEKAERVVGAARVIVGPQVVSRIQDDWACLERALADYDGARKGAG